MENPVEQQPNQPNQSIVDEQNPSARMNPPEEGQVEQSVLQKLKKIQLLKLSRKNILKGVFLLIIVSATFWMASFLLHETLVRDRVPMKFGRPSRLSHEIAAPDDLGYRSFYYFNEMVRIAKENVENKLSFSSGNIQLHDFKNINFWELYGLFKVVKAIQLANGYDNMTINNPSNQIDQKIYNQLHNLTDPVNYTQFFVYQSEYLNKVADQGGCASCYSFPIIATIEFQLTKKTGKIIKLSEQELIDCSNPDPQANGCEYGNMTRGFEYAKNYGIVAEKYYPYRSQTGHSFQCNKDIFSDPNVTVYKIKKFRTLPFGNCKAIQYELAMGNIVATMMNIGRMTYNNCPKTNPNHGVTIVGQTENQDWIVRNSWGDTWGNKGYFIMKKGNSCGVCNHAFVPELA